MTKWSLGPRSCSVAGTVLRQGPCLPSEAQPRAQLPGAEETPSSLSLSLSLSLPLALSLILLLL